MHYLIKMIAASSLLFVTCAALSQDLSEPSQDMLQEAKSMLEKSQDMSDGYSTRSLTKEPRDNVTRIAESFGDKIDEGRSGSEHNFYIFVSSKMPENLIRSYAYDAVLSGATLVVKGINEDENIQKGMTKWQKLIRHKSGALPEMMIDPRGFDLFNVDSVPSIVVAEGDFQELCNYSEIEAQAAGSIPGTVQYKKCKPAKKDQFYKIRGVVNTHWALEHMASYGENKSLSNKANSILSLLSDTRWFDDTTKGWAKNMTEDNYKNAPLPESAKSFQKNKEAINNWVEHGDKD